MPMAFDNLSTTLHFDTLIYVPTREEAIDYSYEGLHHVIILTSNKLHQPTLDVTTWI